MPRLIGTAGHVDHGKTSLLRALTGVDADRLPEEKRRGMTIDLGFAPLDLPRAGRVSVVDVPGHERFLGNMIVGALGVDVALLVVAADAGAMPQTREHLAILDLLPVDALVVALSRADLADADTRALAADDVRDALARTRFADAPILPVSAVTGEGLEDLRAALDNALAARPEPPARAQRPWWVPIDRVFGVKGHGVVVTGPLMQGTVRVGDAAVVQPGGRSVRVRNLQCHDADAEVAAPGQRVALNLSGVRREDLERGMALGAPGAVAEARSLEVTVRWTTVPKRGARVRVSLGADEVMARAFPDEGRPESAVLRLERPAAAAVGQPFIVRRYSPPDLWGGGRVVAPDPPRRRAAGDPAPAVADEGDRPAAILALVAGRPEGCPNDEVCRRLGVSATDLGGDFEALKADGRLLGFAGLWFTPETWTAAVARLRTALGSLHAKEPGKAYVPRDAAIRAADLPWTGKPLDRMLARMEEDGQIRRAGADVADADFRLRLTERQSALLARVMGPMEAAPIDPPGEADLARAASVPVQAVREILNLGREAGYLVRIAEGLVVPASAVATVTSAVEDLGRHGRRFTAAEFRDALQTSRRVAIPWLEWLDARGVTLRQGDARVLRRR